MLQDVIEGFTDDEDNRIRGFKECGELRYQFYRVLPSKNEFPSTSEKSMVRTELVEPFWNYCRANPIVITSSDSWAKPSEAVLASPEVQKFFMDALRALTGREHFVHLKVQGVKEFLSDIGVDDPSEQKFLEALKDENWMAIKLGFCPFRE